MLKRFKFLPGLWFRGVHRNNHVCVDCRYTCRLSGRCPFCRKETVYLGDKWRIPKKNDDKGWKEIKSLWVYKTFSKNSGL